MGFKKGIKREIAAYPSPEDERYFDGFKRSLFIAAKSHESNEVLDPTYILLSWTVPTHLVMGSLLGPMTLMRELPLILILMNLGIIANGQSKLSAFWMVHPSH